MYRESFFSSVHIICKFIFYMILLLCIYFMKNFGFIFFTGLIIGFLYRKKWFFIPFIFLFLLSLFVPIFCILLKILYSVVLSIIFISFLDIDSIRSLLESIFYKNCSSKFLNILLFICYFFKIYKDEFKNSLNLFKHYGLVVNFSNIKYLITHSYNVCIKKIGLYKKTYKLRFYQISALRNPLEKKYITSFDVKSVIFSSILLFFVLVFGR